MPQRSELGIAPDTLRRRNFIKPKAMPYTTATGKIYDSGEFAAHMARAQEIADWDGFNKRAAASKRAGKLRGIGLSTYIEACGSIWDRKPRTCGSTSDGSVTVLIGTQSSGQGHATAYAQIVADHLDMPPERVRMVQGDTDAIATGLGTGGSSSIPAAAPRSTARSNKLAEEIKRLAADALEAAPGDLEFADGRVRVVGTDRAISFADVAARAEASKSR